MKKGRKILATLLTFVCLMATSTSVMAAELQATPEVTTEAVSVEAVTTEAVEAGASIARSASGYAAKYTSVKTGSFTIDVSGSGTCSGATFKSSDFPDGAIIYVNLYGPGNVLIKSNVKLTGNMEAYCKFSGYGTGTYKLTYSVYGVDKGWLHCWVY